MTRIYYFSGTGNGLSIARGLASRMDGAEIVPISRAKPEPVPAGCRVGFVSPVYFMDMPGIVADFVSALELPAGTDAFAVVSMGLLKGNTLVRFRDMLSKKGARSFAGYSIRMPDNSVIFPTKGSEIPKLLAAEEAEIERVASDIASGGAGTVSGWNPLGAAFGRATKEYAYRLLGFGELSRDGNCVGCGLCARVCPVGNIEMEGGRPVWGADCASCFACVHFCPAKSVGFARMERKKFVPYTHPSRGGEMVKIDKK